VAAPAPSPDVALLTALCQDDYYEDTAGRCAAIYASEVLTAEAVLEKYEVIVTDDEFVVFLETPKTHRSVRFFRAVKVPPTSTQW
jgi:hypothetical protein